MAMLIPFVLMEVMMTKFKAYDIDYDTDEETVKLPKTILFEAENEDDASLNGADQISDQTGWCVNSFKFKELMSWRNEYNKWRNETDFSTYIRDEIDDMIVNKLSSMLDNNEKNITQLQKGLKDMATLYTERRTDVADMCDAILDGKEASTITPESRYIKWEYQGASFMYDTLTTLIEVREAIDDWKAKTIDDISYEDD